MAYNFQQYFDFFDQFSDREITLLPYSTKFFVPVGDGIDFSNMQPVKTNLKNLFEHINIILDYKKDAAFFEPYTMAEADRVENLSYQMYGVKDYWWIIMVFNGIRNPFFDLPLKESQLVSMARKLVLVENLYPENIYYQLLFEANELKRNIILPKKQIINDIVFKYMTVLKESISNG